LQYLGELPRILELPDVAGAAVDSARVTAVEMDSLEED
jgi:hypothetical protein